MLCIQLRKQDQLLAEALSTIQGKHRIKSVLKCLKALSREDRYPKCSMIAPKKLGPLPSRITVRSKSTHIEACIVSQVRKREGREVVKGQGLFSILRCIPLRSTLRTARLLRLLPLGRCRRCWWKKWMKTSLTKATLNLNHVIITTTNITLKYKARAQRTSMNSKMEESNLDITRWHVEPRSARAAPNRSKQKQFASQRLQH